MAGGESTSLIVQFAADVDLHAREVLLDRLRSRGLPAVPGLDLGHRGPTADGEGGRAVTAVVINFFGAPADAGSEDLGRMSREVVRWLGAAPLGPGVSVRVEVNNPETGAVAAIDSDTPAEAAALLGAALGVEWSSAPMVWNGGAWREGVEPDGAGPRATGAGAVAGGGPAVTRVLAVADEWLPARGGLSALNRYLCIALAVSKARRVEVYCLVPDPSPREREDAERHGVRLIAAPVTPGGRREDALMYRPALPGGVTPDVVIGHSRVTGRYARVMQEHFPGAARIHFIHMSADDTPFHKPDDPDTPEGAKEDPAVVSENRVREEEDLARGASLVACVGPTLYEWFDARVHGKRGLGRVVRFDPGFDAPDGSVAEARTRPPHTPKILVFGRLSDDGIKGIDLAARAVGAAMAGEATSHRAVEILARGARIGDGRKLKNDLEELADSPKVKVTPRIFTDDVEMVRDDLRLASLVLMPSRVEGFGLAGLEAVVSGTPAVISGASGLGRLVEELLTDEPEMIHRMVVPVLGRRYDDQDVQRWRDAIVRVLGELDAAFVHAAKAREMLAAKRTWAGAVEQLLQELER
ncbi:glycosyltransferase family 4 protein [Streptomyces sp. NPDC005820]|uniref:glycosyltransferase family 4 protein n=1 Tax=Streptomyces sp. NPDC005820 TaxID=3157069 RepID=UPI0033F0F909